MEVDEGPDQKLLRPLDKEFEIKNYFSHFSTKTYVLGTQNNRLNEIVLLSTKLNV